MKRLIKDCQFLPMNFIHRWLNKNKTYAELKEQVNAIKPSDGRAIILANDDGDIYMVYSNFTRCPFNLYPSNRDELVKLLKQTKHNRMIVKVKEPK